jgi:hypothetical protein
MVDPVDPRLSLRGNAPTGRTVEVEAIPGLPPLRDQDAWREGDEIHFYFGVHKDDRPMQYYRVRVLVDNAAALIRDHVCLVYGVDMNNCARILDALAPLLHLDSDHAAGGPA